MLKVCFFCAAAMMLTLDTQAQDQRPVRLALVGMDHGHVGWFFRDAEGRSDIEVVGYYEPEDTLLAYHSRRHNIPEELQFTDLDELFEKARPEAISVFSNTFAHAEIVEKAAPHGIHVMVEKPLAVNMAHAARIEKAATENNIHVLVNYETTWYSSNQAVQDAVEDGMLGPVRKIIVRDGHPGPKEIGVGPEFLEWLTDPVINGGGALTDFGCYGANIMTWLMKGATPLAVSAFTQQFKTDPVYARVDDEATIMVTYPETVGIIQASWNWPYDRKDMDVYGEKGYMTAFKWEDYQQKMGVDGPLESFSAGALQAPRDEFLSLFIAVIRGELTLAPYDRSSLENNIMVTRILDAARASADTGKTIFLSE